MAEHDASEQDANYKLTCGNMTLSMPGSSRRSSKVPNIGMDRHGQVLAHLSIILGPWSCHYSIISGCTLHTVNILLFWCSCLQVTGWHQLCYYGQPQVHSCYQEVSDICSHGNMPHSHCNNVPDIKWQSMVVFFCQQSYVVRPLPYYIKAVQALQTSQLYQMTTD